jgi:hypothetical protein
MKFPKILYFINGYTATTEEKIEAAQIPAHVVFRNATRVEDTDSLEKADGVYGAVPNSYAHYDDARTALDKHRSSILKMNSKIDEEPAPVLNKTKPKSLFKPE